MLFDLSIHIDCHPEDVFNFLRDIDLHPIEPGSPVIQYKKVNPDATGVGTRYLEIVRVSPFSTMQIQSTLTGFKPPDLLAMDWDSGGLYGSLIYFISQESGGTRLRQVESLYPRGLLLLASPVIRLSLGYMLKKRLRDIKRILEQ